MKQAHDEGAGLWTADVQGFVPRLFTGTFIAQQLKVALFHKAPAQRMEAVVLSLFCSDPICVVTAGPAEG